MMVIHVLLKKLSAVLLATLGEVLLPRTSIDDDALQQRTAVHNHCESQEDC